MHKKPPYLPDGKEIKYVPADNQFIKEAREAMISLASDLSHPTGSVVVRNKVVIGRAGNQTRLKNFPSLIKLHKNGLCIRRKLNVPTGKMYWICPGCALYKDHSESLAVKDAKTNKKDTLGADVFLYGHWWCCRPCWDTMIEAGIEKVYVLEDADKKFS